ncbi:DDE-type integrase/transposase/recombinase [Spiroplasma ixodetis]|uniref:DDE-type integrase/transposase/recombinase n=1 Tax=Spiroplasma ixodetis TaxID=2141 RepID=UPI0025787E4D|nr:DDE-type integrase/transposase/recombinase [Spiroplasma ixodetis]WJG70153.1 transposase, Sixod3 group, IS481 family [Spiroplasma ixodetis Y32]
MKYLINSADFTKFDYKFNKFVEKYKNDKNINKVNIYYRKFRKFCFIFKNKNSCKEIISQLHMPKQTFYYWAKRFYDIFYKNKRFEELLFKSTKPKNIKYLYNLELSEKFINYFVQYKEEFGIGAFQFCYLIRHIDDIRFNFLPKPSVKTIYRWLKRFGFYLQKTIKKKHLRYEVKETGLLQTDIKVVSDYITGSKRWYIIDFIDEKTRITYCYPSEQAQTRDIVNATKNALNFYEKLGIKIKRIRTDNGSQYVNTSCGKPQRNRWFTNFCNKKGIVHETTPFRSPQSNGKIERFHRNWSNLFEIKPYLNSDFSLFQKLVNSFQEYYNNSKPHKSLGLMTPMDYFDKLLLDGK